MPIIRQATAADCDTIVAFNSALALESENKQLDQDVLRQGVSAVLDDATKGRYFIAEADRQVIGQLMITFEWSDWRNGWFWWIQSVYIQADYRGQGVYGALLETVKIEAQTQGDICGLRLYVEHDNTAAKAVYDRTGMAPADYQMREMSLPPPNTL